MSIDKKAFGLSDSLVNAVNEALKGGQVKLDKNHNGKLDSQDFKMLRKEELKGDQHKIDANKNGKIDANDFKKLRGEQSPGEYAKANFKHDMMGTDKKMKNEVADASKENFKANMKEGAEQIDELSPATLSSYKAKAAGSETSLTNKSSTLSVPAKDRNAAAVKANQRRIGMKLATKKLGEEVVDEAAAAPKLNVAADMDARKAEVQRKIAAKQAAMQQAKSNKRLSGSPMKEAKCSCGDTKESKMTCEVHGDKKTLKGGKEPIIMNPPLKEASNLPKAVVSKGHEIAKSLIKHKSKVNEPYAVGMAAAKKSAGIKEDAEQVDELDSKTLYRYGHKAHNQVVKTNVMGLAKRTGGVGYKNAALKLKNRKAGVELAYKKAQAKKD